MRAVPSPASAASTVERVMLLAAKRFERDAGSLRAEDDVFESLGIDSVQVLELLSELENELEIELPDYALRGVKTFAQLAQAIDRRL
jgi:acyl carrier protein